MNWDRQALIREFGDFDWQTLPDSQGEQLDAYLDYYKLRFDKAAHHHCGFMPLGEFRIPVHYWRNQGSSRGTALMVHGYYDHVGLYTSLISFCLSQGLDVVAFDLPGHGLADGEPAAIRDFQLYDDVFTQLLTQVQAHTAAPLFAFGQSTGGAILVNYLLKHRITPGQSPFRDIFLLAPLIRPRGWRKAPQARRGEFIHRSAVYRVCWQSRSVTGREAECEMGWRHAEMGAFYRSPTGEPDRPYGCSG